MERQRLDSARAADRRSQVGSGDRSERIRTYNFPQGRVTDHRINLTLYKLPQVMDGTALDELIDALTTEHQAALLAAAGGHGVSGRRHALRHRRRHDPAGRAQACWARCSAPPASRRRSATRAC